MHELRAQNLQKTSHQRRWPYSTGGSAGSATPRLRRSSIVLLILSTVSWDIRRISQWVSLKTRIGEVAMTVALRGSRLSLKFGPGLRCGAGLLGLRFGPGLRRRSGLGFRMHHAHGASPGRDHARS